MGDFIEGLAAVIAAPDGTCQPAYHAETNHQHSSNLKAQCLHDKRYRKAPDSGRKSRHKEGKALRGSAIAYGEQFGTPELIELLLHGKAPDNREEEQHPGLQHFTGQCPDKPADNTQAGENRVNLTAIELIGRIHKDNRGDNADGEIQGRHAECH